MGFKELVGKRMTKSVKFMNEDVKISKLSVDEMMNVQTLAKALETDSTDEKSGFNILRTVIRASVEGAADITDDDFKTFPMDELSRLSNEIMKFSGVGAEAGK